MLARSREDTGARGDGRERGGVRGQRWLRRREKESKRGGQREFCR